MIVVFIFRCEDIDEKRHFYLAIFESGKILSDKGPAASVRSCSVKNPVILTSAMLACFLTSEPFAIK